MRKNIPNIVTSLNLLSGCIAISLAFAGYNYLLLASAFIFAGAVFDFIDGFAARALKAYSELGKQLDSLSDLVTFGIAPSVIVLQLLNISLGKADGNSVVMGMLNQMAGNGIANKFAEYSFPEIATVFFAFTIAIFSALRLAKFNIDVRQTSSFIGLPTPANAMLFASLPFVLAHGGPVAELIVNTWVLLGLTLAMSLLLVSEIPLFSLKFKSLKWAENKTRLIFVVLSIGLLSGFRMLAIPAIVLLYITVSIVSNAVCKKQ